MTTKESPLIPRVSAIMSAPVIAADRHMTLLAAWDLMARTGLRHLLVMREWRCVGVVDERLLLRHFVRKPSEAHHLELRDALDADVFCVSPDTPIASAAGVMAERRLDAVPVVVASGEVVGIVTATDLLAYLAREGSKAGQGAAAGA